MTEAENSRMIQPDEIHFEFDAFISHSSKDREWVLDWLVPKLEQAGLRICVDRHGFGEGVSAIENMVNAIEASRRTVLVLTPSWVKSEWARFESLLAQRSDPTGVNQRVVPVLREQCKIPNHLDILSYLDLNDQPDIEAQLARLQDILKGRRRLLPRR